MSKVKGILKLPLCVAFYIARCRTLLLALVVALVTVQASVSVRAGPIVIDIDGLNFRPYPVAVPVTTWLGGALPKKEKILKRFNRLLRHSADFPRAIDLLSPKSYLKSSTDAWAAPDFAMWVNVGAQGLITSAIEATGGDKLTIRLRFFDILTREELLFRSYPVDVETVDTSVHRFLDALVNLLTGSPGVFSSQIAYVKRTKSGKAIYLSDVDGRNSTRVTDIDQLALLPAWAPNGKKILFTSYLKGNTDLFRLDLRTKRLEWLSKKRGVNMGAAVSPDGSRIALTLSVDGNTELYVMHEDGSNLTRLTNSWGQDLSASWSPDGTEIAFVSSRSGEPHLYIMDSAGKKPARRLTFQGTYNQEPCWSPRAGGQIAFSARDEFLKYDIFVVDPKTSKITRLTQDQGNNERPFFSPDGQQIVFTSTRKPQRGKKLYVMDVDGRNQRRISRTVGDFEDPSWGPNRGYGKLIVSTNK